MKFVSNFSKEDWKAFTKDDEIRENLKSARKDFLETMSNLLSHEENINAVLTKHTSSYCFIFKNILESFLMIFFLPISDKKKNSPNGDEEITSSEDEKDEKEDLSGTGEEKEESDIDMEDEEEFEDASDNDESVQPASTSSKKLNRKKLDKIVQRRFDAFLPKA